MTYPRLLLLAALLPALAAGCKKTEAEAALPPATGPNAAPVPSVPKLDAEDGSATSADGVLRATGSTYALKQAELGPKNSGVLAAVLVAEGQMVKKGQPLFRLDSTNAYLAVKQAEAGLAQARVALSRAELEYNRMKPLVDQGAVSPANWDAVRIGQDQARVGVQQAEANLASVRAIAADTTVVAPFAGIVSAKKKDAGETVTMMPVTTVVILQDISKIEIRTKLPESALTRLKSGDPMAVRFGSIGVEKTLPIDRVNPSVDPLSRTVEIIGVLPNPDRLFKAGMLVDITFPSTKTAATTSPSAAAQPQPSAPTPTNVPPTQAGK
ncbi:MAG: efflux RND transporter periplasmic adaptor subunit [Polyangiaceae bacterium]